MMQYQELIKNVIKILIIIVIVFLVFCVNPPESGPIFIPMDTSKIDDTIPPVIHLVDGSVKLHLGEIFQDPGYRVIDDPGLRDITKRMIKTVKDSNGNIKDSNTFYFQEGEYLLHYNAADSSKNKAVEKTRKVVVGPDIEEPEIILNGSENDTFIINQPFVDPGVEAIDNVDGAITEKIKTGGDEVDISKPGEYKIKYTVSDKAGNKTERYRTVIIKADKNAPKAEAGQDMTARINDPINLQGRGRETDGAIVKYEWKFGNGAWITTSTGDTTITAPSTAQDYVCSLRVTDNHGLTGVDRIVIKIVEAADYKNAPRAKAGQDKTVGINDPINLTSISIDSDGSIVKYEWKIGNNAWVVTSTGDTTITAPSTAQTFVCSLRVTDDDGLTGIDGIVITVSLTVKDIDGNVYHTVKIGNQIWTVENLRTTRYNDSTDIRHIVRDAEWAAHSAGSGVYCSYENTTSPLRIAKFGMLYNWHVVKTGKIAPSGWHVPTDAEWDELVDYLISNGHNWDGTTEENKIGKAIASKTDWNSSDVEGSVGADKAKNNSSGFSGLPGGYRHGDNGTFKGVGWAARWWTATEKYDKSGVYSRTIYKQNAPLKRESVSMTHGFSIRLIKD